MQLPLIEDAISFKDAAHTFLCHALQSNTSSYKIMVRFHFSFWYPDSSERWVPGHLLSTFLTPRSHCHSSGDSWHESALSACWNPAWFFSRQSRLVTLSHLVHSRSPSPAGCSPLQLAKAFIGLLTAFVSPSLPSISVYFILSFRMKAVNLSTAHVLNSFLIINLKLSYKQQWREKIPEACCKITEQLLKGMQDIFAKNFSLRKGFSSWFLVPFRLMILHHCRMDFTSASRLGRCKETALQSCSTNYSYVWQWYWEAELYRKALCCCAQCLLIRCDNLNEQSSKWRTKGKHCWQTCSASSATPDTNFF